MATYTPNNNLGKPEATDEFKDFRQLFNDNMDIIDNMGGGGSSTLAGLTDVTITTPVTGDALIYDGAEWANSALSAVAISGDYSDLLNAPSLAAVATSGDYTDLINTPSLATVATSGLYSDLSGTPSLATVATSGQYSDLSGTPSLATVATSGSYNDLTDKPTIPTVNDGTLTIQQNGTTVGTFTANQSGNTTVNLSGGGGSKHTIVNESGTALADEPNLQFTDGLTATDDSVNTKTKVGVDTTFTEAVTRTNIASGDTFSTILGKIKKWFTDLKTVAFTGNASDLNNDSGFITSSGSCNYSTSSGNADTVDGSHAWNMQTLSSVGQTHGASSWLLKCQHDVDGDGYFKLVAGNDSIGVKTKYADTAGKAPKDGNGNTIDTTYVKKSGDTMTGKLLVDSGYAGRTDTVEIGGISSTGNLVLKNNGNTSTLRPYPSASRIYTFPASSGTLALDSQIPSNYNKLRTSADWRDLRNGVATYFYETGNPTTYGLPHGYCFVTVSNTNNKRGVAIAQSWTSSQMWMNRMHDDGGTGNWSGWTLIH